MMFLMLGGDWLDELEPGWTGDVFAWADLTLSGLMVAIAALIALLAAVFAIGRGHVNLTPEGIDWGRGPFRRALGWDELAPGRPLRAHPGARKIRLETRRGRACSSPPR